MPPNIPDITSCIYDKTQVGMVYLLHTSWANIDDQPWGTGHAYADQEHVWCKFDLEDDPSVWSLRRPFMYMDVGMNALNSVVLIV